MDADVIIAIFLLILRILFITVIIIAKRETNALRLR